MEERVKWVTHKGKKILVIDYKDYQIEKIKNDEYLKYLTEARKIINKQPLKSLLIITDITDAGFTKKSNDAMREFARKNTPYVKASAVVGVTGLKKVVITAIKVVTKRNLKIFDNIEDAKDWLVTVE